ncbi:MAG TPA: TlpA disulfide reductase family protein [Rhodoblastus sp.]|nr:TlpA disulfide reductase family protein [Rhodoblastus sp.]
MAFWIAPASRGVAALFSVSLALFASGVAARAASGPFGPWSGPAPALTLSDAWNVAHSLAPTPGGVVIVHFFATWCEPCREELPALARLARRPGVEARVIAISVAEPDLRVRRFLATTETGFPVLLDRDRSAARAWGVATLPTSFVLDGALTPRLAAEESVAWDKVEPHQLATSFKANATEQK